MNGFCSLLSHQTKSNLPPLQPWDHVLFHKVHFWEYSGMGKILPVVAHKGFYVGIWKRDDFVNNPDINSKTGTWL